MIPALAPLFQGGFASYGHLLRLAEPDDTAIPLSDLFDGQRLRQCPWQFRPDLVDEDERALLSIWSKYYFLRLIPPVLAANLILQRELPVSVDTLAVELGADGLPCVFVLPDDGLPLATPAESSPSSNVSLHPLTLFERLMLENLQPAIGAWQQALGLSPRVLWSNASRYIHWFMGELKNAGLPEMFWAPGQALLEQPTFASGDKNPLFGAYQERLNANTGKRLTVRRTCCIRFRLPDTALCEDCPRLCRKGMAA